jgi:hypothetical protein
MRRTLRRDLHRGFQSWRAMWIDRLEQLRLLRRAASGFRSPVKVTVGCSFGSVQRAGIRRPSVHM